MRHVRILGLALVAVFAFGAIAASNALALKNPRKSGQIFKHCPIYGEAEGKQTTLCFVAATEEGAEEGAYHVGNFTVHLAKQVLLQFGTSVNEETGQEYFVPAEGAPTLPPVAERVPGYPISKISPQEQTEMGWPQELKENYENGRKHHETVNVYETLELAGTPAISRSNLLSEEGTAVEVPLKIKATNTWLAKLGDICYVGSEEDPIVQHLVSGLSTSPLTGEELHGAVGELEFLHSFQEVIITHSDLVDNTYPVPAATCSGPFSSYVEAMINKIFGLPAAAGASNTQLKGTLYNATAEWVGTFGIH